MIYFIRSALSNAIKIGFSKNPDRRARELSLPDCQVIATLNGDKQTEARLHDRFARDRIGDSEWFAASPRLEAYIDSLQHPGGAKNLWEEAAKLFSEVVG